MGLHKEDLSLPVGQVILVESMLQLFNTNVKIKLCITDHNITCPVFPVNYRGYGALLQSNLSHHSLTMNRKYFSTFHNNIKER